MQRSSILLLSAVFLLTVALIGSRLHQSGQAEPVSPPDTAASSSAQRSIDIPRQISSAASSPATPVASSQRARETECDNSQDDDGDGLVDCEDPDCIGSALCRCSGLSCGGNGPQCGNADGCICTQGTCAPCRTEGAACGSDADCCQGMSLHCTEILRSSGVRERRCLRSQARVCSVTCTGTADAVEGTWSDPRDCTVDFIPPGAVPCSTLRGSCDIAPRATRNTVLCWES